MARELCKALCRECPFKRTSAPGWLGSASGDPWEFLKPHFIAGEMPLPCHLRVHWEGEDVQDRAARAPVCRGYMTFLRNTMKMPKDPEMAALYRQIAPDTDAVFSNLTEFLAHHHNPDLALSFREDRMVRR